MESNLLIEKRRLGSTAIEVTPIGLGVMQFSGGPGMVGSMFPVLTQEEKNAIVKAALDGGVNWFDTAELYGNGRSEQSLANALRANGIDDNDVIIATKWFPIFRTAGSIPRTIQDRISYLDGYSIDLYMVHQPWSFSSPEKEMEAMADLVATGKIRSVGVSNFNAKRMQRAHSALKLRGIPLAVNQMEYSLLNRKIETNGVLQAAKDLSVTIVAYSPLARGLLSAKYQKNPELINQKSTFLRRRMRRLVERSLPVINLLDEIAQKHAVTPSQVALNWVIQFQGKTVVAIPGATRVKQAVQNAGAMHFRLTDDEIAQLDECSREFL